MALDYYGRLLRRASARAHTAPATAMEDPFELTAPWLDEPPAVVDRPARESIATERPASLPPLQPSAVLPPPVAPPPMMISPPVLRAGEPPAARSDRPPPDPLAGPAPPEVIAGNANQDRAPQPARLVPPPLPRAGESHPAPPPSPTGDVDSGIEFLLVPQPPVDRALPVSQPIDDSSQDAPPSVAQTRSDTAAVTRLVPAVPRLAELATAPLDHAAAGDASAPMVTIDHLDIEIDHAPPLRRTPSELSDTRRPAVNIPADSDTTSRDLWRGPTDHAFGLGQV